MAWPSGFMRRIGPRIFATSAALYIGLATLFTLAGVDFAEDTNATNAANELRLLSVVLSRQVQKQLGRIQEGLTSLAQNPQLIQEMRRRSPDEKALIEMLEAKRKSMPFFEDLAIFSREGECVAATDEHWRDFPATHAPFYTNGLKGVNFSDIFTSAEGKIQLVSGPITTGSTARGVLVAQVNLSSIYDLMDQKLGVSETTDAFLVDAALRFITPGRTGTDKLLESHLIATPLKKRLKEEFWVDRYNNYFGEQVLGTVARVPGRNWYVVVERSVAEINAPVREVKRHILAASAVLLFALLALSFKLTRSITKPLNALLEGVHRVAAGDLAQAFTIPSGVDELTFLAAEFDKMRAQVAAFQGRLMERLQVSEKKRIESQRLAAIGTLASTLAHEIRNPLNAMSLLLARLELGRTAPHQAPHSDAVLRDLRGEIARLDRLVSDILDYAKPLQLQLDNIQVSQLLLSVVDVYRAVFEQRRIDFQLQLPPLAMCLFGDHDRVKQCLVNVLQNAIDAVEPGGHIEVAAAAEGGGVEIIVRDDGGGFPDESAGRLFEMFYTTKERGTGLGLSTVKKIIDAHGGSISIAKRLASSGDAFPKAGTEVRLQFPGAQLAPSSWNRPASLNEAGDS